MHPGEFEFKREQLEKAIAAQEGLRGMLDDAILDTTIAALQKQLTEIKAGQVVEQQRKQVTILFMDVVDSTRLMRELDPEENMAIMDTALQRLAAPVEAHGGKVTRFMGDGFLAVFGLPRARENDPEMAVRAGLKILERGREISQDLEKDVQLTGFQVRIGVNTGLVVTGGVTEAEDTVMGATVNLASRLESAAPPGGLLISQYTFPHVRGIFELDPGISIQVKGFSEPVQVYRVKRVRPHAFRDQTRGVEGVETAMIGRTAELEALQNSFEAVIHTRQSRFVTVIGEAGFGKSRLLAEFESWLAAHPSRIVFFKGRATLDTLDLPYALLRDLLASQFEVRDEDPASVAVEKIASRFRLAAPGDPDGKMKAHFVAQLLGYDVRDSHYLQGVLASPKQLRDRALVYLLDWMKAQATEAPVVIFLDDIHWADDSSLELLDRMCEELSEQRVLFVALTRPSLFERKPSWGIGKHQQKLGLQRLSRTESERLLDQILHKVDVMPEGLSELMIGTADGNPFYLEELVKMLVEQGVILRDEPTWRVRSIRLPELRIPATLTGVIQARLDRLPRPDRTALQQASVVGKVFWDAVIVYIQREIQSGDALVDHELLPVGKVLNELQERGMVEKRGESAISGAVEFTFNNVILQEVTYESVLKTTRREYHALIADWFIARSVDRIGEVSALIASHLEKAGRGQEALDYLCMAAELAASNFALHEASDFYARALALTPENDLERKYTLLMGQETVFGLQTYREGQQEILQKLEIIVETLGDDRKRTALLLRKTWLAFWTSEFPGMLAAAKEAMTLSEAIGEKSLIVESYYAQAWAYYHLGQVERSLECASATLTMARQAADRLAEGNTLNILGLIHLSRGDFYAAHGYLKEFLKISSEIGDLTRKNTALNNYGVALTRLGDFQAAQDHFQQIITISQETGERRLSGSALINLAWVAAAREEWELARQYAEDAVAQKRKAEHLDGVAEGLAWLGHAWLGLNQPEKAMAAYRESLEIRRKLGQPELAMGLIAGMARVSLVRGDVPAALGHVEEILAYIDAGGNLQVDWEPLRIYLTCYQVLQEVGDPRAGDMLATAFNLLQEQASRIPDPAYRKLFLDNVSWHHEITRLWEAEER